MKPPRLSRRTVFRLAALLGFQPLLATGPAQATTYTWAGNSGNNWTTNANWQGNVPPPPNGLTSTDVIFGYLNGGTHFPSIDKSYSIDSLTFTANADAYVFDTGPLTLGAGGLNQNAANGEFFSSAGVILGAAQTWTLASGAGLLSFGSGVNTNGYTLTVNAATTTGSGNAIYGVISGTGSVVANGAGTLTLMGNNTYTGSTTVNKGTLAVSSGGIKDGGNSSLSVNNGATFALSGTGALAVTTEYVGDLSTGTFTQSGGTNTVSSALYVGNSGPGTYTLSAGTLSAPSEYVGNNAAGTFTQSGGTNTISSALLIGNTVGGTYSLSAGTLSTPIEDIGYSTATGAFIQSGGTNTLSTDLSVGFSDTGTYSLSGTGVLSAPEENVGDGATGTFTQSGGTNTASVLLNVGYSAGGTYSLSGTGVFSAPREYIGYATAGTFTQSGGTNTVSSVLYVGYGSTGTYSLSGTGVLSALREYIGDGTAGTFIQSGGANTIGSAIYVGFFAGGTYSLSAGKLSSPAEYIGYATSGAFTQSGGTNAVGGALYVGSSGPGTYSLNGGVLQPGNVSSNDSTGTFNFNGGTLQATANSATFFQNVATTNVQSGGAFIDTQNHNVTVAENLLHDTTTGAVTMDGGLTKLGSGTLTLTGTNTFTGPVNIDAGTLAVASESNLGVASSPLTVNGGGQLLFTGSATLSRTYNLGFSTLVASSGNTLTFGSTAIITGGYLAGPGTDALGNGSTFNGTTTQVGSTLVQNDGGTAALNNMTVRGALNAASGVLTMNNVTGTTSSTVTVASTVNAAGTELDGTTTINSGGALNTNGTSLYLGGGSRTTVNAGGTLSAASGTTVELNEGLLVNNGTVSGTVDVNYGSTFKGSGNAGSVNVTNGGRFGVNAPSSGITANSALPAVHLSGPGGLAATAFVGPQLAATPATATLTSLALGSGSVFAFTVQDAQGAAGSGYDTVNASGVLTLAAGTTAGNQITVSLASLNSSGTAGTAANFDPTRNYAFVMVTAAGGITGYQAGEFMVDTSAFQNATQGGTFSVAQSGNELLLDYAAAVVPEPSAWVWLMGVSSVGLLVRGHHRRSARQA